MQIKEFSSPTPEKSAYALGAIIAVDKGIGNRIEKQGTSFVVVCDDGSRITLKQA